MKKRVIYFMFVWLFFSFTCACLLVSQEKKEQEHDEIVETVSVTNIQIPVRVFHKKKTVGDLKKEDFQLLINGKRQSINGFYKISKRLQETTSVPATDKDQESSKLSPKRERLFLLIFIMVDYHQDLQSLIESTFKEIIRPGDRLMVLTNHYFFPEWKVRVPGNAKKEIEKLLAKEVKLLKADMIYYQRELVSLSETVKYRLDDRGEQRIEGYPAHIYKDFFMEYSIVINGIKNRYLNIQPDRFIKIAKYLKGQDAEKWVLNFFQVAQLPMLDTFGRTFKTMDYYLNQSTSRNSSSSIKSAIQKIKSLFFDYQMNNTPPESLMVADIAKSFLNSGATFHTMLLKPINIGFSAEYKYESVSSDAETILKRVARLTGGSVLRSNKVQKFIKKITYRDDIVYMLTFAPSSGKKKQNIKIHLPGKDYKVVYDDQSRLKSYKYAEKKLGLQNPPISIEKMAFNGRQLLVKLNNIRVVQSGKNRFGAIQAKIKVTNFHSQPVASYEKTYKGLKEEGVFKVDLPQLAKGKYHIALEVKDLFSMDSRYIGDAITINKR
jgi:hypothetical protein